MSWLRDLSGEMEFSNLFLPEMIDWFSDFFPSSSISFSILSLTHSLISKGTFCISVVVKGEEKERFNWIDIWLVISGNSSSVEWKWDYLDGEEEEEVEGDENKKGCFSMMFALPA